MSSDLKNIRPNRPTPIDVDEELPTMGKKESAAKAIETLRAGEYVVVADQFSVGVDVLSKLRKEIIGDHQKEDFKEYRNRRTEYHDASNRLLAPIKKNSVALQKSPEIGWLEKLYPDMEDFLLPFPKVQGLNSSWQWYLNGIKYPGLKNKLHPYYGAYFPTRHDHLYLFDYWLKKKRKVKSSALDIGTGCGVLSFQLLERGFEQLIATDINPNAVISVRDDAEKLGLSDKLDVKISDLFENVDETVDLIVFNPPWLPAEKEISGLDRAIYYEKGLFERFFDEAKNYLNEKGSLVILFSNFAEVAGVDVHHPVEKELENNTRYKKVKRIQRRVTKPSSKTKRPDHRKGEFVELWELTLA